jgi:hypothetical protein
MFLVVSLVGAGIFGIILLADGDWLPGGIIVAASLTGLAVKIPVIRGLGRDGSTPSALKRSKIVTTTGGIPESTIARPVGGGPARRICSPNSSVGVSERSVFPTRSQASGRRPLTAPAVGTPQAEEFTRRPVDEVESSVA